MLRRKTFFQQRQPLIRASEHMRVRNIVLAVITLFTVFVLGVIFLFLPPHWGRIEIGMSRSQVVALVGAPELDTGDIKGSFWLFGMPPLVFTLNVFFDSSGKAVDVDIRQFIGPENEEYVRHVLWKTQSKP